MMDGSKNGNLKDFGGTTLVVQKLSCIGIIGDGCGGGREFIVQNGTLSAYNPDTQEEYVLLEGIKNPLSISKKKCIITIVCQEETINFDLSKF